MTEYECSCHVNNKIYTFRTCGAVILSQAIIQFSKYVGEDIETADGLILDRVEE